MSDRICAVRSVESAPRSERPHGGDGMIATPFSTRSTGTATVSVRGQQVTVDCPAWCTHPHAGEYRSLEDVWHEGREVSLALPGSSEQVVGAQISSWPFAGDPNTASAYMSVFLQGADYLEFTPAQAIAFADQMMACAEDIRAMAEAISGGVR